MLTWCQPGECERLPTCLLNDDDHRPLVIRYRQKRYDMSFAHADGLQLTKYLTVSIRSWCPKQLVACLGRFPHRPQRQSRLVARAFVFVCFSR